VARGGELWSAGAVTTRSGTGARLEFVAMSTPRRRQAPGVVRRSSKPLPHRAFLPLDLDGSRSAACPKTRPTSAPRLPCVRLLPGSARAQADPRRRRDGAAGSRSPGMALCSRPAAAADHSAAMVRPLVPSDDLTVPARPPRCGWTVDPALNRTEVLLSSTEVRGQYNGGPIGHPGRIRRCTGAPGQAIPGNGVGGDGTSRGLRAPSGGTRGPASCIVGRPSTTLGVSGRDGGAATG
jgi:hypothetical protein